jgi:hypothetical protein
MPDLADAGQVPRFVLKFPPDGLNLRLSFGENALDRENSRQSADLLHQ